MDFHNTQLAQAAKLLHDQATTVDAPCRALDEDMVQALDRYDDARLKLMQAIHTHFAALAAEDETNAEAAEWAKQIEAWLVPLAPASEEA